MYKSLSFNHNFLILEVLSNCKYFIFTFGKMLDLISLNTKTHSIKSKYLRKNLFVKWGIWNSVFKACQKLGERFKVKKQWKH